MKDTRKLSKMPTGTITRNLRAVWEQSTPGEIEGGCLAYSDYHRVMHDIAARYGLAHAHVTGVFCALSPNADWLSNLRSALTMAYGFTQGYSEEEITVTTYHANRARAWRIINGEPFHSVYKGPKVRDFFQSICEPTNTSSATIDGHLANIARAQVNGMWYSGVTMREYKVVRGCVQRLAVRNGILPLQMQAILWFTWKRIHDIKSSPEAILFEEPLRPYLDTKWMHPYPRKQPEQPSEEDYQLLLPGFTDGIQGEQESGGAPADIKGLGITATV